MLIEAGLLPNDSTLDAEICIIGGGVAGITLALEFDRQGIATCVLEGGGLKPSTKSQGLYEGENVGLPYDLQATRTRRLGGSSNCWGGWIRPFISIDFEERDWIPNSGWPFRLDEVEPYYRRADDLVQVNHHGFEPAFWHSQLNKRIGLLELDRKALETVVSKFSPPTRFGRDYYAQLVSAKNTKVILNANAVQLATCSNATTVRGVHVMSASRSAFFVRAKHTILAAGGIENARLLLLSNSVDVRGLGNQHDLVGRYFMEHPRIRHGRMTPARSADPFRFYDARFTYHNPRLSVDGTSASAHLALSEQIQRRERLLQCRTYFRACRSGEDSALTEQFHELYNAVRWRHFRDIKLQTYAAVVRHSPNLMTSLLYRRLKLAAKSDYFQIETVVEPAPDRESRVTLSSQRDRLGLHRAHLDWRIGDHEKRTHLRMLELVRDEFARSGLGHVDLEDADKGHPLSVIGCAHHMGTTRMHVDPRQGVVDQNCKVHGMHNLHVAGSSIFPTCGNDMPTLTIVALALRLADHIKAQYGLGSPAPANRQQLQMAPNVPWAEAEPS
ncbi:FAD-dependent oxidoreductase [Rhizobium sp. YTU87027]|uniref:FAD-dependent oxidoreductase n=1 Tax=Rhizobium sp. YTU87027 TaxID=3417741 RepID=UPI003D689CAC